MKKRLILKYRIKWGRGVNENWDNRKRWAVIAYNISNLKG